MRIDNREIKGKDKPVYVIAEIGVNHDGSIDRACDLVEACASAGADAVKTQYFRTEQLMSRSAMLAAYQRSAGETDPIEMLCRLELSVDELRTFVECAHAAGVHAIVTPFGVEGAEEMRGLAWDAFKTASPDVIHQPMLELIASDGRPMIVSTGASTMDEVARAACWLEQAVLEDRVAFLHCVSCYPAPTPALEGLLAMRVAFESGAIVAGSQACEGVVGYSDHTGSLETMLDAAWVGAAIIEKHVTMDRTLVGPDHAASITPAELADAVNRLRVLRERCGGPASVTAVCLRFGWEVGDIRKVVLPCERDVRRVSRQSIVLTRAVLAGDRLTREMVTFKRPGTGIEPFRLNEVLGRTFVEDVEADTPVLAAALGLQDGPAVAVDGVDAGMAVGVGGGVA